MMELTVMPASSPEAHGPAHDVRNALPWREFEAGLTEARRTGKPLFCLAESHLGNAAQRLALFLEQDEQLAEVAGEAFVPVLVDPSARPDLVDQILVVAHTLQDTVSPPLLALLTEEGLPLVTFCHIDFEGADGRPSLLALLRATSSHYARERKECLVEARGLQLLAGEATKGQSLFLPAFRLWREPDAEALTTLLRAGIHDQLGGSFHRAGRMQGWGVPHFEKTAVHNAAMAAVLLRTDTGGFADVARVCSAFALRSLQSHVAGLASNTDYYTWNSGEIVESLPPDELQLVGLHYRIGASSARHVLNQVRPVDEAVAQATGQEPELARRALEAGKTRLLQLRLQRQAPAMLPAPQLAEELTTIRFLLKVMGADGAAGWLAARLEELTTGIDTDGGLARAEGQFWLHDQVAALQALRVMESQTGAGDWAQRREELTAVVRARYRSSEQWVSQPGSKSAISGRFDHDLPGLAMELQEALA